MQTLPIKASPCGPQGGRRPTLRDLDCGRPDLPILRRSKPAAPIVRDRTSANLRERPATWGFARGSPLTRMHYRRETTRL